jgi:ligand-binding sensor domain-containing protein
MVSFFLAAAFLCPGTASGRKAMRFKRYSIEDGLSQSSIEGIVQDRSGMIWIATEDGLNRFDGYEFTVFRNDPDDTTSISNSNIWCIHVDRRGHLWAGTYTSGLNRFDPETETFTRYRHDPEDPGSISSDRIRFITDDAAGNIWISTPNGGINRLDPVSGRFERFLHDDASENSLPSNNVRCIVPDSGGVMWIATNRGFSRFDTSSGMSTRYRPGEPGSNSLVHNSVRHIMKDRGGILWLSTGGGLSRFDPVSGKFTNYVHDEDDPGSISSNSVRMVFEDSRGQLYVATSTGGLCILDRETEKFTSYRYDAADQESLSHISARVIFEDSGGLLWVGTFGGGVNVHDPGRLRFRQHRSDPSDPNSLSDYNIWSVAQGPAGDLWFGTNSGELNRYIRKEDRYVIDSRIPDRRRDGSSGYIRSLLADEEGSLWVASAGSGVFRYYPSSGNYRRIHHDPSDPNSLAANRVRTIYRDTFGELWFCHSNKGLDHFDPVTGRITNFRHDPDDPSSLSNDVIVDIAEDSEGIYWVATRDGLNRIKFIRDASGISISGLDRYYHDPADPRSLSNSYILSMHEADGGDIWFGTMQGLSRLSREDRGDPSFTRYLMKDGLPNDVIYGILEDDPGYLWLSTNFGLSRLDTETEEFKNYDSRDGLHGNEFNTGTFCRTREGTFIFGGVGGATEFHPDSIRDSSYMPPVVLTGFNVFDRPAVLERSLPRTEKIVLSHSDNYFSFEFASLDYSKPDRNRFQYILEGLDREWTNAGTRNFAGYTQVDPGSYTFKVMGTNGDGVWSDHVASIRIVITPPFWRTWWFITLVVLAASATVASIIVYRVRQLLAIERLRSKIAADLHDDIGAGLTEISIMGEVVTTKLPDESKGLVAGEIDRIGTTSRRLIESMSDIVWLVNPKRDSLFDLISRLGDSYKEVLHTCGVHLRTENLESLKNAHLSMEYRQNLFLLFKEAINNAMKYSGCGEMSLSADLSGRKLTMRLVDDGDGFETGSVTGGNGLRNMRERAERIGGILEIRSSRGGGTTIEFRGRI